MTGMPQIQSIRRMGRNGESMASIARKQHVSGPTVRKYLRMDDLSEKPPVRKRRGSVVDPYPPLIERWLAEDRGSWRKQRHTATRIWEWLRDEHGAEVSLSTVSRAVARLGRESAVEPGDAFVDLVWHPDEARADFGEVDVLYGGAVQRMRRFVPDFPYSNIGLAQLMPGENAECACQALLDLFEWLGGVPERIVFDNAAGVGRRTGGAASAGPACSRRSRRTTGSRAPCARRTPDTRRARSRRRSAWSGASCSCPNRACGTWRTSTPDCRTGAWSSAGSPTTPRTRRRPSCSRRTAGPCFPCPGNVSTWSRGSA